MRQTRSRVWSSPAEWWRKFGKRIVREVIPKRTVKFTTNLNDSACRLITGDVRKISGMSWRYDERRTTQERNTDGDDET